MNTKRHIIFNLASGQRSSGCLNKDNFASSSFRAPIAFLVSDDYVKRSNTFLKLVLGVNNLRVCSLGHPSFTAERSKDLSERDSRGLCFWYDKSDEQESCVEPCVVGAITWFDQMSPKCEKAPRFPGCCCARR